MIRFAVRANGLCFLQIVELSIAGIAGPFLSQIGVARGLHRLVASPSATAAAAAAARRPLVGLIHL